MKSFVKLLVMLGLLAYLVFAFVRFNKSTGDKRCEHVVITVEDAAKANFVTVADIRQILKDTRLDPTGKHLSRIRLSKIQKAVNGHQFVLSSLCYITQKGDVVIDVKQKLPILRIMPVNQEGYYVDANGNKIQHVNYPADVIVVTGYVDYKRWHKVLTFFSQVVQDDPFWNDMIEQINITSNGRIELTPRLGDHIVELGRPANLPLKLSHLKIFYQKVINEVGWDKYSRISLEYDNEVVCTKKE